MVRGPGRTRLALALSLFAALGCNALIGADEPRLRQEDAATPDGLAPAPPCVLNSDCAASAQGHVCIFRVCSPPCRTDGDCVAGSRCLQTATGTACVTNLVSTCSAARSCPAGSVCQGASCRNACGAAGACLSQQDCVDGVCVGTDPAHDPGVDGGADGSVDQSTVDQFTEDASVDQSTEDGGATDGGPETEPDANGDDTSTTSDAAPDTRADAGADAGGDTSTQPGTDASADGGCGDTSSDPRHCGSCSHDCTALPHVSGPVTCGASGQCAFALSSCAAGWTHCSTNPDQGCETSLSTTSNCGACGNSCPSADPVCSGSGSSYSCVTGCSAPTPSLCGSTCVDTATDPGNCGTCGHACAGVTHGQPNCAGSACSIRCSSGYSDCSGACVDETSDDGNCGGCGTGCSGGEHCVGSVCQCIGGQHLCSGTCVANDTSACGASCTLCAAPSGGTVSCSGTGCVQACTVVADAVCSGACVNESSDDANCGGCGTKCTGGTTCQGSSCLCPSATHTCPSGCASNTSTASCGTTSCSPCPGPPSGQGSAACDGVSCGMSCNTGYSKCVGDCVDEKSDASNCNACGHVCPYGACSAGVCAASFFGAGNASAGGGPHLSIGASTLLGNTVTSGASSSVVAIGAQTIEGNLHLRLGLYSDAGGKPGTLLVQTGDLTTVAGGATEGTVPATPVAAGAAYWVMVLAMSSMHLATESPSVTWDYETGVTYGPLPATVSAPATLSANLGDLYFVTAP